MKGTQLNINTEVDLVPAGDTTTGLYDIVDRFRRGTILKPPHQRDPVWELEKKRGWVNRLKSKSKPVGAILTYQINDGQPSPVYLNDGYQRVSTTLDYLLNPQAYGDTDKGKAEDVIRSCNMPHQHRWYKSHDEALVDFQQINLGTALTPFEFCKGILTTLSNYEAIWSPNIESFHEHISENYKRLERDRTSKNRETRHKYLRHDLLLITRQISKIKNLDMDIGKNVATSKVKLKDIENKTLVEWRLREIFETKSVDGINREINALKRIVAQETALIETIWYEELSQLRGYGISATMYRWLLELSLWRREKGISEAKWREFVFDLLKYTEGRSKFETVKLNGKPTGTTLNIGRLSQIRSICRTLNSDFYEYQYEKRSRNQLKSGYDNSHMLPFSNNGDGETFPEPSGMNRARGARPVAEPDAVTV